MVQLTTTHRGPKPAANTKPFAWSYSKLKNFESCPKRHWHIDIAKDVVEPPSEALEYGNFVHDVFAKRIGKGIEIPEIHRALLEPWAVKVLTGKGNILVEQKLAITKDFAPCTFFDKAAWYRGIGDVVKINGPVALVLDWKTGKILEDGVQLALMAACVFAHHTAVQRVRSEFVWLKENATTSAIFSRDDIVAMWSNIWPRITALREAHEKVEYPAKPGPFCRRWCPVKMCPHHGEGR